MLLVDSHLDLSWNAITWNRDLTWTISQIREAERGWEEQGRATNTVSFPELRNAEVVVCLATALARVNPHARNNIDFRSQSNAYAMAQGQLAYYRIMQRQGEMRMLRTAAEIDRHVEAWKAGDRTLGFVFSTSGTPTACAPSASPTTAPAPTPTARAAKAASCPPAASCSKT
jgi:membrane dipeptidase